MLAKMLYWSRLEVKAWLRKLYSDFARELTVLLCAAVILFLFVYVFKDLIEQESIKLSYLKDYITNLGVFVFTCTLTNFCISKIKTTSRFASFQLLSGDNPQEVRYWNYFRNALLCVAYFCIGYLVLRMTLAYEQLFFYGSTFAASSVFWVFSAGWRFKRKESGSALKKYNLQSWREIQIFKRNSSCKLSLLGSFVVYLFFVFGVLYNLPVVLLLLLSFFVGLFMATALALQLKADCCHLWLEHSSGISQEIFLTTYNKIAVKMFAVGAILLIAAFIMYPAFSVALAIKVLACMATPLGLFASYALLLDPKRPLLQIMIIMLLSLFIITTIYIHILGVVLIAGAAYYGYQHQIGFLYRIPPC